MKRTMIRTRLFAQVAALSVLAGFASAVPAQGQKMVLRVADSFPVTHYTVPHIKYWMETVTAATNGQVQFEYYPSEQLGKAKDLLALTQSGVIDIGYVAPSYVSDKLPLSGVVHLPGTFSRSCPASIAYHRMAQPGGLIHSKELAPNGMRLLFAAALQPYQVFSVNRPINSAQALEGMKIRSAGGVMDSTVRKVGAVPIQMASPEITQSLSRGTLDGAVFAYTSVVSYGWGGLLKYATHGENFGSFLVTYMISERKWKELSPAVQKAMLEAGEATTRRHCAQLENDEKKDIEKLRQAGMVIEALPKDAKTALSGKISQVAQEWARTLDQRGKPGSEILKKYLEEMKRAE